MTGFRTFAISAAATIALAGCQEKLSAPGECPGICPGSRSEIRDTVVLPVPARDSTFGAYVDVGQGASLQLSNGLDGHLERGIVRFVPRPETIPINGTDYTYTIDSVALGVSLQARDPAVTGLYIVFYRLPAPATIDSSRTFAEIESALVPANIIDSVRIDDTLRTGTIRRVFSGADLARVALPAGDGGRLALAYRLSAPAPTGVRIGSSAAGSLTPTFVTYVTASITDAALQRQTVTRIVEYSGFVSSRPRAADPGATDTLTVGGAPSVRSLVRFALPARIRDSTSIVRATLELTPMAPIDGLPGDSVALDIRAVLADLGAKSPRLSNTPSQIVLVPLVIGSTDTVRIDVTSLVDLWQPPNKLPASLFIGLQPEGSSFTRVLFGSTRAGIVPRLRLTYAIPFPFETP